MSAKQAPRISIIVPVLNESARLQTLAAHLHALNLQDTEILIVDGGSSDDSLAQAQAHFEKVLSAAVGRSRQMNAGAAQARGDILVFLHADSQLPHDFQSQLPCPGSEMFWGRFDVRVDGDAVIYRIISAMMNLRSRVTGIATGDQAIYVSRLLFEAVGGYPDLELMEDIELSARLRRHSKPRCLSGPILTSARRWQNNGVVRTIMRMWFLRAAWFCGVSSARLARWYG